MGQGQSNKNNPRQSSGKANPSQGKALSVGEIAIQEMLSIVKAYNLNAAFFNTIIGPLIIECAVVLPLPDKNKQIRDFLTSYLPGLDAGVNGLYGRVGLAIPEYLQGAIATSRTSNKQETVNHNQSNTSSLEQG